MYRRSLFSLVVLLLLVKTSLAQPPQLAQVVVINPGNQVGTTYRDRGTGSYVAADKTVGIVTTNWHVINDVRSNSRILCIFLSGKKYEGRLLGYTQEEDIAIISIEKPDNIEPLVLAEKAPAINQPVSAHGLTPVNISNGALAVTYNGVQGRVINYESSYKAFYLNGLVFSGNSGGPVLDSNNRLVGVLWGQSGVSEVHAGRVEAVRRLIEKYRPSALIEAEQDTKYTVLKASEIVPGDLQPVRQHDGSIKAVEQLVQRQVFTSSLLSATNAACQVIVQGVTAEQLKPWFDKINQHTRQLGELFAKIQQVQAKPGPRGEQGPKGDTGEQGPKGDTGEPGQDAIITPELIQQIVVAVLSEIDIPTPTPPTTTESTNYIVVVGNPEGRYYNRLTEEVDNTKEFFSGIKLEPTNGENLGTLPALILYVDGKQSLTFRGTSDVYRHLSRIRRGEWTF